MSIVRKIDVTVLSADFSMVVGKIAHPLTVSTTWQWQGIGTAVIICPETDPVAGEFLKPRDFVIPVVCKAEGYPRWTGFVINARAEKTREQVTGRITATLVSPRKKLTQIIAAPVPGAAWSAQSTAEYDTRTGKLHVVARGLISANIARINAMAAPVPDLRMVVTNVPAVDTSPTVTIKARNKPLAEELSSTLQANGYDVTVDLWLPGDPQPNVATPLTQPTWVVDVVSGRSQMYVNFSDDNSSIANRVVSATHPSATAYIVGGPGEGTARPFEYVLSDDGRQTALGPWGYSEVFVDASDADTSALRIERAREKQVETSGQSSVFIQIDDRKPWIAGPTDDYWVGDEVRATFNGVTTTDRITRMTLTSNAEGFTISPQLGDSRETETPDIQTARMVQELAHQITALKAGK